MGANIPKVEAYIPENLLCYGEFFHNHSPMEVFFVYLIDSCTAELVLVATLISDMFV